MKVLSPLILAIGIATPVYAQSDPQLFQSDCAYIGGPMYMCDDQQAWITLELPEDLQGIGRLYDNGIEAEINVMQSVWVGIQVRAQKYGNSIEGQFISEELTKIDGFPAITYVSHVDRNGQDAIKAQTHLLLFQVNFDAETYEIGDTYTPEHAAQHAAMLQGIKHDWSLN